MPERVYESWGRYPRPAQRAISLRWREEGIPAGVSGDGSALPFGNGRSYGDVCLNEGGLLLDCRGMDRFISFDPENGILRCEAGVLLHDILRVAIPQGWFLPVVPGTQWVTLGGAVANDIHGKNHHRAGTFGRHVRCVELLRTDGSRRLCSPSSNADWFAATIAGLGLTGVVTWAEMQLKAIPGAAIDCETIRFGNLSDFFALARESDEDFEYTVAWVDALSRGSKLGRGLFFRGNHSAADGGRSGDTAEKVNLARLPPLPLVNRPAVRLFNALYAGRQRGGVKRTCTPYGPFFFPLDAVGGWNRFYGRDGLLQYQFVVPLSDGPDVVSEVLELASRSDAAPFLTVLKVFGDLASPGLLSFPRKGVTMAVDFPNRGRDTMALMEKFDHLVRSVGGAVYPAKDARMSGETFQACFPEWSRVLPFIDPGLSSGFWRRVTGAPA